MTSGPAAPGGASAGDRGPEQRWSAWSWAPDAGLGGGNRPGRQQYSSTTGPGL